MANLKLEKNQAKEFSDVLATYNFTAEGGGAEIAKSPDKEALKPGIRLHFLRYGLFYKKSSKDIGYNIDGPQTFSEKKGKNVYSIDEIDAVNKEIPDLENFYIAKTALNAGYVYLINDEDPENDYYEYEVSETGILSTITWGYERNKDDNGNYLDQRTSDGDTLNYKVISQNKKFWVAYSPIQWSRDYIIDKLIRDTDVREKRMTLIDCSGIKKGNEDENANIVPYNKVRTSHLDTHPYHETLKTISKLIDIDEKRQDQEDDENTIYEDMFIALDDPIGCAQDVSEIVSEKGLKLKATVDAIQSGETFNKAFSRLQKGELEAPQPDKEYQELFTLALTCYKLVYNQSKTIYKYDGGSPGFNFNDRHSLDPRPKYSAYYSHAEKGMVMKSNSGMLWYGLDYKKIKGILGIDERNKAREKFIPLRTELGQLLNSDYIRKHLDDYLDNHPERLVEGRNKILNIIDCLSYHPYKFDRHLMLEKEFKEEDQWLNWVYNIIDNECPEAIKNTNVESNSGNFKGIDPLYALVGTSININAALSNAESFSKKIAGVYNKNLKYRASQVANLKEINGRVYKTIAEKQTFIVDKLNQNLKVFGQEMFEIRDGDIWMRLEELGVELDPEYNKQGKYTGKRADVLRILKESNPEGFEYTKIRNGRYVDYQIKVKVRQDLGNTIDLDAATSKKMTISKVVNGKAFNGVFALLELYNFHNAIITVTSEGSTGKDFIYTVGSAVKLGESGMNLTKILVKQGVSNKVIFRFASTTLSAVGGGFSVGWCFYDSYVAIDKGDMDTGLALVGAGVAFGISTMASLGIVFAAAGPIGWIAAAIGVGLLIIATLLTDSALESYFKNFLLCDREAFPKPEDTSPMQYMHNILTEENRKKLTNSDYHNTLMNPYDAQVSLFDIIVCKEIEFKPINQETETYNSYGGGYGSMSSSTKTASSFTATMVFARFFNHPKQVQAEAYFYPEGVKNSTPLKMDIGLTTKIYDIKNQEALQVKFSVPTEYVSQIKLHSEVVFAVRLKVDESQKIYFPHTLHSKERYLGAKIRLRTISTGLYVGKLEQNEDVIIAPLAELKTKALW